MQSNRDFKDRMQIHIKSIRLVFILIFLKAFLPSKALGCESNIRQLDNRITFSGCISRPAVDELVNIMSKNAESILTINSAGGDVEATIELANQLLIKPRKIYFDKQCSSSCANYLLPVGFPGMLASDLSVIVHGDAKIVLEQISRTPNAHPALGHLTRIAELEDEFRNKSPRAEWLHQVQRLSRAEAGAKIFIKLQGKELVCTGLGLIDVNINIDPRVLTKLSSNWIYMPIERGTQVYEQGPPKKYDISSDPLSNCSNT